MGPKKNRKNAAPAASSSAESSGVTTRSRKSDPVAEMTYYTTLSNGSKSKANIQVISKNKLKSDPANFAELVRPTSFRTWAVVEHWAADPRDPSSRSTSELPQCKILKRLEFI